MEGVPSAEWRRHRFCHGRRHFAEGTRTLCFLWEKRHIPIVLVGTKTLFDNFYQSKLTEDVRGQLTVNFRRAVWIFIIILSGQIADKLTSLLGAIAASILQG